MYNNYKTSTKECRNVEKNGDIIGFHLEVESPYFTDVYFHEISMMRVRVDNIVFSEDDINFTLKGHTYTLREMETIDTLLWNLNEKATLFVPYGSDITNSSHVVEVGIGITRNNYSQSVM